MELFSSSKYVYIYTFNSCASLIDWGYLVFSPLLSLRVQNGACWASWGRAVNCIIDENRNELVRRLGKTYKLVHNLSQANLPKSR